MIIADIAQQWNASLRVLLPKNIVLLLMVSLKGLMSGYYYFFRNFWGIVLLYPLTFCILQYTHYASASGVARIDFFRVFWFAVWIPILSVCIRPSVLPKGYEYFLQYWMRLMVVCIVLLLGGSVFPVASMILSVIGILYIFFLLDHTDEAQAFFKSIWPSSQFILDNPPVVGLLTMIWCGISRFTNGAEAWCARVTSMPVGGMLISGVLSFVLISLLISFVSAYWTKRVYDSVKRYC